MHAHDRHTAVQNVHAELSGIAGYCSATAGIDLGKLGILEIDLTLIELSADLCDELRIGIGCPALSSGTRVFVEYDSAAEE